jgi:hypothetical protein
VNNHHIGFTGTQRGMTDHQKSVVELVIRALFRDGWRWVHHGDCIGADREFHDLARAAGFSVHLHPPVVYTKRAFCKADAIEPVKPFLVRNHDIVDASEVILATPKEAEEVLRSGTWATIRYARKTGKLVKVILP